MLHEIIGTASFVSKIVDLPEAKVNVVGLLFLEFASLKIGIDPRVSHYKCHEIEGERWLMLRIWSKHQVYS